MKEWFKKYLGWVGFGVWVALTLAIALVVFLFVDDRVFTFSWIL
jgi:hypothetical protein